MKGAFNKLVNFVVDLARLAVALLVIAITLVALITLYSCIELLATLNL